ncbi:MAG: cytochrome c oxidase subunit II [cyanobacterium endosymbiont of Rhopalodia musculus]|uniref:cytochrome c oxidase subunit II n=1 Tax=cyanobacterium endosymbiont of Epithemia clementina EcSB TaxID=3034674 RepID=UPI002480EB58|nr:cytochrome c oxidase subunit II [cyanobacterium endosymbiont of Epithemia clementina EcSB]WGT67196.1 cytochrome c oxidase subunit II [cyanobacterium endosymbiont of Epithemia clementina EcSB]
MKIPSSIITLIVGVVITLISLWYGQHHGLMPVAASYDATQVDGIFNFMISIAIGLFLLVEGTLVFCLIKFRRRPNDQTDGPPIEGNVPLEIFWTAIPTVIVFILALYSFEVYSNMGGLDPVISRDTPPQQIAMDGNHKQVALGIGISANESGEIAPLMVKVQGMQYAWVFTYPETGITSGELHVPKNRPVQLTIAATDVLHSFWVPQLRLKQDAIPGRDAMLAFTANREGDYPIVCAELCGAYHGGMRAVLHVEDEETYAQWEETNKPIQKASLDETVAVNPKSLSGGEFLRPYAHEMGIHKETLAQVPHP